jgi:hypothetical protein
MSYDARRAWMREHIKVTTPTRQHKPNVEPVAGKRNAKLATRKYYLPGQSNENLEVCKVFFLHTLGYANDKVLSVIFKTTALSNLSVIPDRRGRHTPALAMRQEDREAIRCHIESYKPCVSHYRREHAPNRRYLSSELTMKSMFHEFKKDHQDMKCCYETYRETVSSMNISFAKLGQEQCETCLIHERHKEDTGHGENSVCSVCLSWHNHIESANVARRHYQNDCVIKDPLTSILSTDMQKVMMLPRIPGVKSCVFTRRIVAFHQTFAPLGCSSKTPVLGVIWHEGVSGRNSEDVASAYVAAMAEIRDCQHFVFWADNCAAQNKNWTLYTCLATTVNTDAGPES